jgi:hypothetical protein
MDGWKVLAQRTQRYLIKIMKNRSQGRFTQQMLAKNIIVE